MDALGNVYAQLIECGLITATGDSTFDIDMRKYFMSPGNREIMATLAVLCPASLCIVTGLVCKFEQCSVSVSTSYADVTGGAFTDIGAIAKSGYAALQTIWFGINPAKPFLRLYHTLTGAGATVVCEVFMVKRQA
jgi:hypothetical protein